MRASEKTLLEAGRRTVSMELEAIRGLGERIGQSFSRACGIILECRGRIIVTGMGKSGHIGRKIAATLASTGTPAFFVHPGEANHGDLGMITRGDVAIAISNSGRSAEIMTLVPLLKQLAIPLITLTGNADSPLALEADAHLDISVESEACPLDLAPTSSTTATLVMGDALAVALLEARRFTAEDFAFTHPGGALGRRLLLKVSDIMHRGEELPAVSANTSLKEALLEMTRKGLGMTTVTDQDRQLVGVFTDGDLRRTIDHNIDIDEALISEVMSPDPNCVSKQMLATEALGMMEQKSITAVVVTDEQQHPVGVVHMHDLLRAGIL